MSCGVPEQRHIEYGLGELAGPDEQRLEEHIFECDACAEASTRVSSLIAALRQRIPATLTEAAIDRLERRGMRLRHTRIQAGERVTVPFGPDVDLLVHRLQLDLAATERLDCELVNAADGAPLVAVPHLVFEPQRGEVNLVCMRHYAERLPPDASIRLIAVEPTGRRVVAEYGVLHVLPDRG
jgi:hypothetical protein